jgi:adenylate kinase
VKSRIVLLGPPASGKGTQAELMTAHYGIPVASPGAILREETRNGTKLGLEAETWTSQGKLLPDAIIGDLVRNWLDARDSQFVFDGFPRSLGQADALEKMMSDRNTPLEIVLALETNLQTLQNRVANRMVCTRCGQIVSVGWHVESASAPCPKCCGELGRRSDDTPEALAIRMVEYYEKTEPLLEYYASRGLLCRVDGMQTPQLVFAEVSANLDGK